MHGGGGGEGRGRLQARARWARPRGAMAAKRTVCLSGARTAMRKKWCASDGRPSGRGEDPFASAWFSCFVTSSYKTDGEVRQSYLAHFILT